MLKRLVVTNYALIETLDVSFEKGFGIITGETGSGKSILLGALGLVLGVRADSKSLRNPQEKCVIEAEFLVANLSLKRFFESHDLDYEDLSILRRELTPSGKSRAFINDTPVSLSILKKLGESLVDIHSQHQTLKLSESAFQYDFLDAGADTWKLRTEYKTCYSDYKLLEKELLSLKEEESKLIQTKDYAEFQLSEFDGVDLENTDIESIENELAAFESSEEIVQVAQSFDHSLYQDEGVVSRLNVLKGQLSTLSPKSNVFAELLERLSSVMVELQDVEATVQDTASNIDFSESRHNELIELSDEINRLLKKFNCTSLDQLAEVKVGFEEELLGFTSIAHRIEEAEFKLLNKKNEVLALGDQLKSKRRQAVPAILEGVHSNLSMMKMSHSELNLEVLDSDVISENGTDALELKIKTNKGGSFQAIGKIASGGEMSRIMLAIKVVLNSRKPLGTVIFDEIDTGVSGEVAQNMAEIMKELSVYTQVMSITHLPQIASRGTSHYAVSKSDEGEVTKTTMVQLGAEERLIEIAKMLSGNNPTSAAISNAKEMLN